MTHKPVFLPKGLSSTTSISAAVPANDVFCRCEILDYRMHAMNSRKIESYGLRSRGSDCARENAGTSASQPSALEAAFAEMIALLPDVEPSGITAAPADRVPVRMPAAPRQPAAAPGTSRRKSPPPARQVLADGTPLETDGETIAQRILEFLEKQNLFAVSQLRIEVHAGVVVATGEVSSVYEKQLLAHFCRQVPGVASFIDATVVREPWPSPAEEGPVPLRRPVRRSVERRLPFRAWHAGAAVGLVTLVWAAFSLGRGHVGPERLAVYPLTGKLLVDGQPAAGAAIVLHPQDPSLSARPRATVQEDGSIVVTTYEPGDGAPAGEYKATIEWRRASNGQEGGADELPPPNVLPPAYANAGTTPLKVTVEEGETEFPQIQFKN
ncbi:MAG: BON domain-containing protein [Deltaproteobacteria bacterium]